MTGNELYQKIRDLVTILDADELPELHDFLFYILDNDVPDSDGEMEGDPCGIAKLSDSGGLRYVNEIPSP